MPTIRRAIYPGTFDPITNGHLDVLGRAADIFDEVIVSIGTGNGKTPLFTEEERKILVADSIRELMPERTNISVAVLTGLLVEYATKVGAKTIVRGLRAVSDFDYEFQMALMNRKLEEEITTIFLMPHERYTYLNSTIIRELARYKKDVTGFVPICVASALKEKF